MLACVDAALDGGCEADRAPAADAPRCVTDGGAATAGLRAQRRRGAEARRPAACWTLKPGSTAATSTPMPATASSSPAPPARPPTRCPAAARSSIRTWRCWSSRRSARTPSPTGRSWCPRAPTHRNPPARATGEPRAGHLRRLRAGRRRSPATGCRSRQCGRARHPAASARLRLLPAAALQAALGPRQHRPLALNRHAHSTCISATSPSSMRSSWSCARD